MDEGRARTLLRAERSEVSALLQQTQDAEKINLEAPDSGEDYADGAQPLTEQANDAAVADQLQSRLDAIDRALARLEAGSYGRSVLSGKPIPAERLEADPAAELTIEEANAQRLPNATRVIALMFRDFRGAVPVSDGGAVGCRCTVVCRGRSMGGSRRAVSARAFIGGALAGRRGPRRRDGVGAAAH